MIAPKGDTGSADSDMSGWLFLEENCRALLWLSSHCSLPCVANAVVCAEPAPSFAVPRAGLSPLLDGATLLRLLVRGQRASEQGCDSW